MATKLQCIRAQLARHRPVLLAGLVVYLYILFRIDPSLIHRAQGRLFLWDPLYLGRFTRYPGGISDGIAIFAVQFFEYPWAGAFVLTALLAAVTGLAFAILRRFGGRFHAAAFVPALLLLVLLGRYDHPLAPAFGLVAVLALGIVFLLLPWQRSALRLPAFVLLAAGAYAVAGAAALLLGPICALFEWVAGRRASAIACLALAAVLPYAAAPVFQVTLADAYTGFWPARQGLFVTALLIALWGVVPLAALAAAWAGPKAVAPEPEPASQPAPVRRRHGKPAPATTGRKVPWRSLGNPVLAAMGAAAVWFSLDPVERLGNDIERHAQNREWSALLRDARSPQAQRLLNREIGQGLNRTLLLQHDVGRALYHEGRLLSDLFAFPQFRGTPSLLLSSQKYCVKFPRAYPRRGDLFLQLGRINEAEQMAFEGWARLGERREVLRALTLIYLVKERPEAARTFLLALGDSPLERPWANARLSALTERPRFDHDRAVQRLRAFLPKIDVIGATAYQGDEQALVGLVKANPHNRMALEYLLAFYLLEDRPDRMAEFAPRMHELGYVVLPRHCEEALLLFLDQQKAATPALDGISFSDEAHARFRRFKQAQQLNASSPAALWDALLPEFGNTYWFYHVFGVTSFSPEATLGNPNPSTEAIDP